jgi:N-acetylglucosamine-6-phosphate deacetylase
MLTDRALGGSTARMNECVRNLAQRAGRPLHEALRTASANPDRALRLGEPLGSLEPGIDASLVAFDEEMQVRPMMVRGRAVFRGR